MSSKSDQIDGEQSDVEIIRELAEGDDIVAELFEPIYESMDDSSEVSNS
jgi:hypothetical protein